MKENDFDLIIEPKRADQQYWADLWRYKELFYFLAWRDILVRYKQTVIGILWSVLKPLLTMWTFVLIFNKVAKIDSENAPYPILVFAALLPWQLFSNSLAEASNSLISNSNLISKVYFPRIIVPISSIIVCLIDFLLSFLILAIFCFYYSFIPTYRIIFLPLLLLLTFGIASGAGIWLAALNVKYRDFRHVVPFIIQFGLYISPVGFSSEIVPEKWRVLYSINPMVGIIDGFRWCLLNQELYLPAIIISIAFSFALLIFGIIYFRKMEKTFADNI